MNISDEATRRLSQWAQLVQEHPRRLAAIVGTCLLVGGSGAFAVASLGPDPSDLPVQIVLQDRKCSTSYIQRKLAIGYNKAARLVEQMEEAGLVSAANHVGKREVLVPEQ